jgi:hypothetical protein
MPLTIVLGTVALNDGLATPVVTALLGLTAEAAQDSQAWGGEGLLVSSPAQDDVPATWDGAA